MNSEEEMRRISDLVEAWLEGEHTMFDAVTDEPDFAWLAILEICRRDPTDEELSLLAAGPVQSLLSWHGTAFIDRILVEAKRNPKFRHLLGGVWSGTVADDVWKRVQDAREKAW